MDVKDKPKDFDDWVPETGCSDKADCFHEICIAIRDIIGLFDTYRIREKDKEGEAN